MQITISFCVPSLFLLQSNEAGYLTANMKTNRNLLTIRKCEVEESKPYCEKQSTT